MIPHQNIARWLPNTLDPIAIEDWVANREIFGPVVKPTAQDLELEKAYAVESGGEISELLLFRLEGKSSLELEVSQVGEKTKKMKVKKGDFYVVNPGGNDIKVKITGKNVTTWEGGGKQKIVIEAV